MTIHKMSRYVWQSYTYTATPAHIKRQTMVGSSSKDSGSVVGVSMEYPRGNVGVTSGQRRGNPDILRVDESRFNSFFGQ